MGAQRARSAESSWVRPAGERAGLCSLRELRRARVEKGEREPTAKSWRRPNLPRRARVATTRPLTFTMGPSCSPPPPSLVSSPPGPPKPGETGAKGAPSLASEQASERASKRENERTSERANGETNRPTRPPARSLYMQFVSLRGAQVPALVHALNINDYIWAPPLARSLGSWSVHLAGQLVDESRSPELGPESPARNQKFQSAPLGCEEKRKRKEKLALKSRPSGGVSLGATCCELASGKKSRRDDA